MGSLIGRQIKIEGFTVDRWQSEFAAAGKQLVQWVKEVSD